MLMYGCIPQRFPPPRSWEETCADSTSTEVYIWNWRARTALARSGFHTFTGALAVSIATTEGSCCGNHLLFLPLALISV